MCGKDCRTIHQSQGAAGKFTVLFQFETTGWTPLANVTGWAAISLPLATTSDGLPIGVQLMAADETILLQLAAQLETAMPWLHRRPTM
jgi:amidase